MVHLYCHPSWANVADEPSGSNEQTNVPPLPPCDAQMNESEERNIAQWNDFGVPSLPSSDARLLPSADVNGEVTVFDEKYWFDQVAALR
eukprot:2096731-Karenia_brevis.AAC.1